MNKQTMFHSYNWVLLTNGKVQTIDTCNSMDESQNIMLRERRQTSLYDIFIWRCRKVKTIVTESRSVDARSVGRRLITKSYRGVFWDIAGVVNHDWSGGYMTICLSISIQLYPYNWLILVHVHYMLIKLILKNQ